ncbi:MAG: hypothetical protein ACKPKO_32850, partial [Candidatus Fonsibacter sp.]
GIKAWRWAFGANGVDLGEVAPLQGGPLPHEVEQIAGVLHRPLVDTGLHLLLSRVSAIEANMQKLAGLFDTSGSAVIYYTVDFKKVLKKNGEMQ